MFKFKTILQGQRAMVWDLAGRVRYVDGPRRLFLFRKIAQDMRRYAAEPDQYLVIKKRDGTTEHVPGPATCWFDPVDQIEIKVEAATKIDANEALIVYRQTENQVVRRVLRGPAVFVPTAQEWVHAFSWHGAEAKLGQRKLPHALKFTKLRVIPDQMYFDVESVRTTDDALVVIKLMLFYELVEIEKMLDQTHDPVADFINALSADVIDFVGGHDFEIFKTKTEGLNQLETYPQLRQRAENIGYRVNKVVYRGYYATDKLQAMHDNAIECRTRLHLEAETEQQAQELADLKLQCELNRTAKRQEMEQAEVTHQNRLKELEHRALIQQRQAEAQYELETKRNQEALALDIRQKENDLVLHQEKALHEEQVAYFAHMRELQVDLTRYLVAQYQNPDKVIRIDGQPGPQLHVHEN
jgi:hypothetical protein